MKKLALTCCVRTFFTAIKKGQGGCFVELDAVSHALEFADQAIPATVVVVDPAHEPVTPEVGVGGAVVQQMPADGQDGMRHSQRSLLLPDPPRETPKLRPDR
ncbi:hypothetical protein [Mycobacteroides salmoniphilum]|uniref:hypothetical protein n=1 Tax=Mycobacteroides salmoniphilum TaxID=404941 RepID=UPI0015910B06|nr:hypothetical protein [Mycobacteroides salmoniphilum]